MDMPTGAGFRYKKKANGDFSWESLYEKKQGYSYAQIEWINFEQSQAPFNRDGCVIRHEMNGGERKFSLMDPVSNTMINFWPDGHTNIDGVDHFFFFDGCYYHECEVCEMESDRARDDTIRNSACEHHGVLHTMTECEWNATKNDKVYVNRTSYFFNRRSVTEDEIWNAIDQGYFFGLIRCDIKATPEAEEKFKKLNFPPIFAHVNVEESMIETVMAGRVKAGKKKFPLAKQLSLVFNHKDYLLTTELALFYKENGFILSNLSCAIEFERDTPFKNFVNMITKERIDATRRKRDAEANCCKLVANAAYGRTIMRKDRHRNHKIIRSSDQAGKRKFKRVTAEVALDGEFDSGFSELELKPSKVTDNIPVHYGFCILQNSKLHFLRCLVTLYDYCDVAAMRLIYVDTGNS